MTPTELKLMKIIWENGGKAPESKLIDGLKISQSYSRLICGGLTKNKIVRVSSGQFEITDLGKKQLEKLGVIEKIPDDSGKPRPPRQARKRKSPKPIKKKKKSESETKREVKAKKETKEKVKAKQKIKVKREAKREVEVKKEAIPPSNFNQELVKVLKKKRLQALKDMVTAGVTRFIATTKGLRVKKAAKIISGVIDKLRKKGKRDLQK